MVTGIRRIIIGLLLILDGVVRLITFGIAGIAGSIDIRDNSEETRESRIFREALLHLKRGKL